MHASRLTNRSMHISAQRLASHSAACSSGRPAAAAACLRLLPPRPSPRHSPHNLCPGAYACRAWKIRLPLRAGLPLATAHSRPLPAQRAAAMRSPLAIAGGRGGAGPLPRQRLAPQGPPHQGGQQLSSKGALLTLRPVVRRCRRRRRRREACATRHADPLLPSAHPCCSDTYYVAHVKDACAFLGDGMSRIGQQEEQARGGAGQGQSRAAVGPYSRAAGMGRARPPPCARVSGPLMPLAPRPGLRRCTGGGATWAARTSCASGCSRRCAARVGLGGTGWWHSAGQQALLSPARPAPPLSSCWPPDRCCMPVTGLRWRGRSGRAS